MKKTVLITILLVLATMFCFADELDVDFSMDAETKLGLRAPWTDPVVYDGRFTLADTSVTSKLGVYNGDFSAFTEFTYSYCHADSLSSLFKKNNNDETPDSDGRTFSMNEFWADYSSSFWGIRVGRQKAAWGKADGIDITNVLCPSDMSSFAAMTSDNSKLGIDAVRLSFNGDSFTADAWWIPVFTPSALPLDESNHLRKLLVPQSVDFPIPMLNTVLKLPVKIGELEKPEKKIQNGEFGLKLSGYFSMLDVSLYGFYGWDDIPLLNYGITFGQPQFPFPAMPNGLEVSGKYERMAMLGADAALPIGETVIRMEAAFFPQRHFQKSAESILGGSSAFSEQHNELSALVGIDWMPAGWTFTAQYYCDYVAGKLDLLDRTDSFTHGATFSVSRTFLDETLEASFSGVINFDAFDTMFAPSVKYSVSDQLSVSGGAYIFLGGPHTADQPRCDGQYGKYRDLSTFYISAKFSM
ncbi:MAG: hypothetical protein J5597_02065 [Spirochaetaceae bacterium]|nr:hypothetical protein [Spirochaetaceae bacterium]